MSPSTRGRGSLEAKYARPACAQTTFALNSVGPASPADSAPDDPATRRRAKSAPATVPTTARPVSAMTRLPDLSSPLCANPLLSLRRVRPESQCVKLDTIPPVLAPDHKDKIFVYIYL